MSENTDNNYELGQLIHEKCYAAMEDFFQRAASPTGQGQKKLVPMKDICLHFQKSRTTINSWIKEGLIKPYKIGRSNFFHIQEIQESIDCKENPVEKAQESILQDCKDKWKYLEIKSHYEEGVIPSLDDLIFYHTYCKKKNMPDRLI